MARAVVVPAKSLDKAKANAISSPSAGIVAKERRFGEILKQFREDLRLTQRTLGIILGVDPSTIARIEAGSRLPPKEATFYANLRSIPGLGESHVAALMAASDAPQVVKSTARSVDVSPKPLPRVAVVNKDGIRMIVQLEASEHDYPAAKLDQLLRSTTEAATLFVDRLAQDTRGDGFCPLQGQEPDESVALEVKDALIAR